MTRLSKQQHIKTKLAYSAQCITFYRRKIDMNEMETVIFGM
ncbi:hypothetical protein NT04LM_4333, partial [Listeria monocytogenes FSL F2-208]